MILFHFGPLPLQSISSSSYVGIDGQRVGVMKLLIGLERKAALDLFFMGMTRVFCHIFDSIVFRDPLLLSCRERERLVPRSDCKIVRVLERACVRVSVERAERECCERGRGENIALKYERGRGENIALKYERGRGDRKREGSERSVEKIEGGREKRGRDRVRGCEHRWKR